jgi:hypothetical protein
LRSAALLFERSPHFDFPAASSDAQESELKGQKKDPKGSSPSTSEAPRRWTESHGGPRTRTVGERRHVAGNQKRFIRNRPMVKAHVLGACTRHPFRGDPAAGDSVLGSSTQVLLYTTFMSASQSPPLESIGIMRAGGALLYSDFDAQDNNFANNDP